jgi:DNA-binding transcriptional MocR family regulator
MRTVLHCSDLPTDNILITSGSQQGLDFSAKIFIDPGSIILMESPTSLGAISAFASYQPTFVEVDTDEEGMVIKDLQSKITRYGNRIRLIYVIPDFQNPSGITWSMERRKSLLRLAKDNDLVIVEDNPYGVLNFDGEALPSIYSLDHEEEKNVIFLGTFSKIVCPGYRLGWVCASEDILVKFIITKQGSDLHSSTANQWELSYLLDRYNIYVHIKHLIELYKHRSEVMVYALKTYMPHQVKYMIPKGGLFNWLTFPMEVNTRELNNRCMERNVAYVPGGPFFANGGKENYARLCYSYMPDDKIVEGIKILGECLHQWL